MFTTTRVRPSSAEPRWGQSVSVLNRRTDDAARPSGPHRFVAPSDPRSGLAVGAVQPDLQMAPGLAVAYASLRVDRCAASGCGKPRTDPIHSAPE
jgi:hypothetical protein